jgi:alpha-tubulin suppressor-like RCC1 family protein
MNANLRWLTAAVAAGGWLLAWQANGALQAPTTRGTVVGWGVSTIPYIEPGTRFTKIAAGARHNLALKGNGTVVAWGDNSTGQCRVPSDLSAVVTISAGGYHSLALMSDGAVAAWGNNYDGQSTVPVDLRGVVSIAVAGGRAHSLALKSDGKVVAWGNNEFGQSTVPTGLDAVLAIGAGADHSLALKSDGTVVTWGANNYGQSMAPAGLSGVVAIAAGFYHSLALKSDGTVVAWGANYDGQSTVPTGLNGVRGIAAGGYHNLALKNDGTVEAWGKSYQGQSTVPTALNGIVSITAGAYHSLALKSDGEVVAWGMNQDGESNVPFGLGGVVAIATRWGSLPHSLALNKDGAVVAWGDNTYGQSTVPVGLSGVVAIAAGAGFSLALKSDGTVAAWGGGTVPDGLTRIVAISASGGHSLALKSDGTVVAWGSNSFGQSTVPEALGVVVAIAAGGYHSLALKSDGTVAAWGRNSDGQISTPTSLSEVVAIAAGGYHNLALKRDGTVTAWGANWSGASIVPTGLTGVVAVAAGSAHSLALKSDGTVVAWGDNSSGQSTVPSGLSGVVSIAAGYAHSLALKADPAVAVSAVSCPGLRGSGTAEVSFNLALTFAATATVGLSVSTDGGATFTAIPGAALSGDAGSGVAPGARRVTWNAAPSFPAGSFLPNVKVRVTATAGNASASADSPRFVVDLQGGLGGLTVEGRVRDASGAPVAGATVTLGGQSVTTTANGVYRFTNISLAAGITLVVSVGGQSMHSAPVSLTAGARQVAVPDVQLPPIGTPAAKPVVTSLSAELEGIFLAGVPTANAFTATVNWRGATPGRVDFLANDSIAATMTGAGPDYTATLDVGTLFLPSFTPGANRVRVVATSAAGVASDPLSHGVPVLPLPSAIARVLSYAPVSYLEGHVGIDWDIPKNPVNATVEVPGLGKFGAEVSANVSVDYEFGSGDWKLSLSAGEKDTQNKPGGRPLFPGMTREPRMKLYVGNKELTWSLKGSQEGKLSATTGFVVGDLTVSASVGGKLELGRYGAADMFGPGLSTFLADVPGLGKVVEATSLIVYAKPELSGSAVFAWHPDFDFKSLEAQGKIGLEAVYEPELTKNLRLKLYAGGELTGTIQHPGNLLKSVRVKGYAGAEATAFVFKFGPVEYVWLDYTYPASGQPMLPAQMLVRNGLALSTAGAAVRTVDRPNLAAPEQFVAHDERRRVTLASGHNVSQLEAFRAMARGPGRILPGRVRPMDLGGPGVTQVDLTLVQGVFPDGQPALAGRGNELMLLYVADNGGTNALQFTDIKWTRYDGTNWIAPAFVASDTRSEFAPQVAFDGNGDAIAVWERVGNTNFTTTNLSAMAAEMEIVWSRWARSSGTWTEPVALTTNGVLDHAPLLAGPLASGDLLLAWTRNAANLLMGTGAVGSASSSTVLGSRWDAATRTWTTEQALVASVPFRLSQSLAAASNTAVYAWTRDLDGVVTNAADQQVFAAVFTNGAWLPPTQFTTGTNGNASVRAAVSATGGTFLVWRQGPDLVMSANFATTNTIVRAAAQTAGFGDYALTFGPGGNLVAVWQEMSADGPDAFYAVFDPVSSTWSRDVRLFADASLERSFAPVWDAAGNLTVAYNRVDISKTNRFVALSGGGTLTITNVPQGSRVDLAVVKRALVRDVALLPGDFSVAAENFLPGAAVTLSALLRNTGDLAVTNATVGFFNGDPAAGGVLLTNATISGWLPGASNVLASALWVVPQNFSGLALFAMADPSGTVAEFNETNNVQSVSIGGTDLAVSVISAVAETNGVVRVITQVQNLGAPAAPGSALIIRRAGQSGTPLATATVPALEPGRLAQVALDLPAATQLAGTAFYTLIADETRVTGDVNTNNNTVSAAVQLALDSDGDGIPDDWELANGLNPFDPTDAARDDDGDGISNLAEFHARTNPRDRNSFLRMATIGGSVGGIQVGWASEANRLFTVERSSNLRTGFTTIAQRVLSTSPETTWFDTTATNAGPYFYRVKVE